MRFSASITTMFREHPPLERPAAARAAGFEGIEIQVLEADPRALARAAAEAGVEVVLLNVAMGDFLEGGAGLSGVPGREAAFAVALDEAIDAARLMNCPVIHAGPSRVPAGVARDDALAVYRANLRAAQKKVAAAGRDFVIEAMNRVDAPTALLPDCHTAVGLIRDVFDGEIGLLFDIYHVARNGEDVGATFRAYRDHVRHVQFSDVPGRCEPGAGTLDFPALFEDLAAAGYEGWFGAEYRPTGPTARTLGWLAPLL